MTANVPRRNFHPTPVPNVESLPCPALGSGAGRHQLAHIDDDTVACVWCSEAWWVLDAAARAKAERAEKKASA